MSYPSIRVGRNPSKKGVSTPITAIVVSTALILLASHVATSSFAAIDAMGCRQLNRNSAAAIHYCVESLCLSESPAATQFILAAGPSIINITGSTIYCEGADFAGLPDPAGIVLSSGAGFIEYDPGRVAFRSSCVLHATASVLLRLSFDGNSDLFYLEARAS